MLKIAGEIIDVHDDTGFGVLLADMPLEEVREKFAGKTDLLDDHDLTCLPESRLGAIFCDGRNETIVKRAYPLHTGEHAELSSIYFMKAASSFPEDVRNQIASQINHGLYMHGIDAPADLQKWAADHGDWRPADNYVDISMHDPPSAPADLMHAFSKEADGLVTSFLPCRTAEETAASIRALTAADGPEDLGLSRMEAKKSASALKFAAEAQGVVPPAALLKMACVDERALKDVESLLTARLRSLREDLPGDRRKLAADSMRAIMSEPAAEKRAVLLQAFDSVFGIGDRAYGKGMPEPFDVMFEPAVVKRAESQDDVLARLGGIERIRGIVGEKKAAEFEKDASKALGGLRGEIRLVLEHGN